MSVSANRVVITDATRAKYPQFKYSRVTHELCIVDVDVASEVVIVGDPNNGCYEWLIRTRGVIETYSDVAYGDSSIALRDGLIAYHGLPQGT